MKNHLGEIIGIVQVLNKKAGSRIVSFNDYDKDILIALASQAAVSIENAQLYQEVENFIESTVEVLASAIETRDPATAGHSRRIANYALQLARATGKFNDAQLREL